MPDRFGFNLLGATVRCIDCPIGGPIWQWPARKRNRHARTHRARATTPSPRRQRNLLATPPTNPNEEKEATTMANQRASKREPAKRVAIDVLQSAGTPLHAKEIAKRVIESGRCPSLKGKTPEATITAMLAVGSKPGGPFTRVDKGTYSLDIANTNPTTPAQPRKAQAQPRAKPRTGGPPEGWGGVVVASALDETR